MLKYSNSRVYKIIDNTNNNIYIGSTTQQLSKRLAEHTRNYKSYLNGISKYITSFEIIKNENYDIILLENVCCETKEQLRARERFHIESNTCVNKNIPGRSKKELGQIYRDNHKEERKEYDKQRDKTQIKIMKHKYYEKNKEKFKEYQKEHKEHKQDYMKVYNKQYREENLERIKEQQHQTYICECGRSITRHHKLRHERTQIHLDFINSP